MSTLHWLPSGKTQLVPIVGYPVSQVKAPTMYTRYLRNAEIDAFVVPIEIAPTDFACLLAGLAQSPSIAGIIVTIPHKVAALSAAAKATDRAARVGAANVLRRLTDGTWFADMVDGLGLLGGLTAGGFDPAGRRVLVVGAGGAGSAIAAALLDRGSAVVVQDIQEDKALALAERLPGVSVAVKPELAAFDLVVNATPRGMHAEDRLPFDPSQMRPDAAVAEVVMDPALTPLLSAATAAGLRTFAGSLVLAYQLPLLTAHLFANQQKP